MKNISSVFRVSKELTSYMVKRSLRSNKNKIKIFCIGRNKTGTTSLASFFRTNGYKVGNQEKAELLMEDWARRDFTRIIKYCKTAEVFQDVPFSLPYTYEALDQAFPNSKFILTLRSSSEEWYHSLVTHHSKLMSSTSGLPSEDDLSQFMYRKKHKGFILFMQKIVYGYPTVPLYDRQAYMTHYENHNVNVLSYFKDRPKDMLILNLGEASAFEKLCDFMGLDPEKTNPLPHKNRSSEMKANYKSK